MYFTGASFEHPQLQWWLRLEMTGYLRVQKPVRSDVAITEELDQVLWKMYLLDLSLPPPLKAVLEPVLVERGDTKPRDRARQMMSDDGFLISFDVWWKGSKDPSKGFLPLPSAQWFHDNMQTVLPQEACNFFQVILPERSCEWYFDIDAHSPTFPIERFLQALFEAMVEEEECHNKSVEELWKTTILLDSSKTVEGNTIKSSCHGVCKSLVFPDNHITMKDFAKRVKYRLEQRGGTLFVEDKKKSKMVIPMDLCVYSHYQNFRMMGSSKMTPDTSERRVLAIAPYNKCVPANFKTSLVGQPERVSSIPPTTTTTPSENKRLKVISPSSHGPLETFLLQQVRQWGNHDASISATKDARQAKRGERYVSFSKATYAWDHKHTSNNLFAIVSPQTLQIFWHCHQGNVKCKSMTQTLPLQIALEK